MAPNSVEIWGVMFKCYTENKHDDFSHWTQGLEVSSKEVGVGNLETSDSGVGFNTALPLDTDTDAPDQIPDSEGASISVAPETKPSSPPTAESKPAAEIKPSPVPETKVSPAPKTKKTPDQPKKEKLDAPKPPDSKLSSTPSPEPKAGLSPADPKPAPSPSPEPKAAVPTATTPTPESKTTSAPPTDPAKPTSAEPITNGTPEPGPDAKASPDHADIMKGSAPKEVPPKTHEVELKSSAVVPEAHKDGSAAEESSNTTWELYLQDAGRSPPPTDPRLPPLQTIEHPHPHPRKKKDEESTAAGARTVIEPVQSLNPPW